jgi:phage baseplate assembly protein W
LLATQKGSDPLRPDFGIDLLNWIDKPTTVMAPGLVKEIIDQVAFYETRIDLTDVNYSIPSEKVVFTLMWRYKDGNLYRGADELGANNTVYFLLSDQDGFILLSDNDVSIIVN